MNKNYLNRVLIFKIILLGILTTINCVKSAVTEIYITKNQPQSQHVIVLPIGVPVLRPYIKDCTKLIKCYNGYYHIQSCDPGTVFNIELKICEFRNKINCLEGGSSKRTTNDKANFNIVCPIGDNGLHPYPNDCTKFIECTQGQLYKKDCSRNMKLNRKNSICDEKYNLQCDWNSTDTDESSRHTADILCPKVAIGLYAFPFNFKKYINCSNGKTWIQNCAENTTFSITKGSCIASDVIDMKDYIKFNLKLDNILVYKYLYKCPHHGQHNHLYPFDAAKYINCSNEQLKIMSCASTQVFSLLHQACFAKDEVSQTDSVPFSNELSNTNANHKDELHTSDIIYCTLDLFGLYPHPFDNTKYLKCVYGRLYSQSCRTGYVYSLSRKFCDIKDEWRSFDTLPSIQDDYKEESKIEIRLNDSLTYLKCPVDLDGTFVYPFDCTKYLKCLQGTTKIVSCSNNDIYNIRSKQCQPGSGANEYDHVECLIKVKVDSSYDDFSLGVFCSPTGFSKHPHPRDWHNYVQCDNGKLTVERCPRDQVFSLKTRQCVENKFASKEDGVYD